MHPLSRTGQLSITGSEKYWYAINWTFSIFSVVTNIPLLKNDKLGYSILIFTLHTLQFSLRTYVPSWLLGAYLKMNENVIPFSFGILFPITETWHQHNYRDISLGWWITDRQLGVILFILELYFVFSEYLSVIPKKVLSTFWKFPLDSWIINISLCSEFFSFAVV